MDATLLKNCLRKLVNSSKKTETLEDAINIYNDLKGKRKDNKMPFWDVIAFTTANKEQKQSVEQQIDEKLANKDLPIDIPYIVVCDPPGTKIGSGGANFLALGELYNLFGERLFALKVLLIHTGGQSRRLPSHSVLGKLFAIAPMGDPIKMILDLKMAMYQPFIARMKPGVFVTASDDIETYCLELNDENNWSFENDGFTALAHPSSIEVGMTHGVYVLPQDLQKTGKTCWTSSCLRVLQKPSYKLMQEAGAICKESGNADGLSEFVYSDSAYFFSHSVSKKLLSAIDNIKPYNFETDAYGDFLQPLGKNSNKSYINPKSSCAKAQKVLYDLLKDVPISIVVLKKSTFYHLGTMEEYVTNITENKKFISQTGSKRVSFTAFANSDEIIEKSKNICGVIMFSVITDKTILGKSVVLECCDFEMDIEVERGLFSNCQLKQSSRKTVLKIPPNMLWHTASVTVNERIKYVTCVFNLKDDLKDSKKASDSEDLQLFDKSLGEVCQLLYIDKANALFPENDKSVSLWTCQIFPVRSTREGSFLATLSMAKRVLLKQQPDKEQNHSWLRTPRMSMNDIMEHKCITSMLNYQKMLKEKISFLKNKE